MLPSYSIKYKQLIYKDQKKELCFKWRANTKEAQIFLIKNNIKGKLTIKK